MNQADPMDYIDKYIKKYSRYWRCLLLILLIAWIAILYSHKINIMVSDLGRHIKNGEIFIKEFKILTTNYYSYTNTDYPFPTHHWGVGVVYYIIWSILGFKGLSIFNTLLMIIACILYLKSAEKLAGFKFAFLFTLMVVPLLLVRREVRPENFSYLFSGIMFYFLVRYHFGEIGFRKSLLILIPIQIVWVNIHIFFIFGIAFTGLFWLDNLINHREIKHLSILLGALVLASTISPFHIKALLEPFLIFQKIDMKILENAPIPLIKDGHFFGNTYNMYFKLIFFISVMSFLLVIIKMNIRAYGIFILFFLLISIMTWRANRFISMFGLTIIPMLALNQKVIVERYNSPVQFVFTCLASCIIIGFIIAHSFNIIKYTGIGIRDEKMNNAAYFYKRNNLHGPILNNMNIGSYLIFHLFPKERVFYDARPEAYPVSFISEVYRPMLQKNEKWLEEMTKYNFRTIFFYMQIMTDYEKSFLERRIIDPSWKRVYTDEYCIILVRK